MGAEPRPQGGPVDAGTPDDPPPATDGGTPDDLPPATDGGSPEEAAPPDPYFPPDEDCIADLSLAPHVAGAPWEECKITQAPPVPEPFGFLSAPACVKEPEPRPQLATACAIQTFSPQGALIHQKRIHNGGALVERQSFAEGEPTSREFVETDANGREVLRFSQAGDFWNRTETRYTKDGAVAARSVVSPAHNYTDVTRFYCDGRPAYVDRIRVTRTGPEAAVRIGTYGFENGRITQYREQSDWPQEYFGQAFHHGYDAEGRLRTTVSSVSGYASGFITKKAVDEQGRVVLEGRSWDPTQILQCHRYEGDRRVDTTEKYVSNADNRGARTRYEHSAEGEVLSWRVEQFEDGRAGKRTAVRSTYACGGEQTAKELDENGDGTVDGAQRWIRASPTVVREVLEGALSEPGIGWRDYLFDCSQL